MNKKDILEKLSFVFGAVIVVAATWFWTEQVQDVLEILEMAYG